MCLSLVVEALIASCMRVFAGAKPFFDEVCMNTWTVVIICIVVLVLAGLLYREAMQGPIVTAQNTAIKQAEHPNDKVSYPVSNPSRTSSVAQASSVAPASSVVQ